MATVKARVLLGWMPRDMAVHVLTNQCDFDPPIGAQEAERIWREHRDRAAAVAERPMHPLQRLPMTLEEQAHVAKFTAFLNSYGPHDVIEIAKIDLSQLVTRQFEVIMEHATNYATKITGSAEWLSTALPLKPRNSELTYDVFPGPQRLDVDIDLPHGEFAFEADPAGIFRVREGLAHVTIMESATFSYLWAGYHRSFARASSTPTAIVPGALVAVARNVILPLPPANASAPNATVGDAADAGLTLFGRRAPRLSDFFTDGLFMEVNLRKKRWQMQVRTRTVALDAA